MDGFWGWVASPAASVAAGLTSLLILRIYGKHRDKSGKAAAAKIAFAILQGAALYTLIVAISLHWFVKIPLAETLTKGFGQDRFAWLFLGIIVDLIGRMYALFDPD